MTDNSGGPAFPVNYSNERDGPTVLPTSGMTLRDYFAAKAMQANLTRLDPEQGYVMASECKYAYEWADAMLKARETS